MNPKLDLGVLECCPYEPPTSGWVIRVKLLRRLIEEQGGTCIILDIGPNRKLERPDCVSVMNGSDYLRKLFRLSKGVSTIHSHINGEYIRGLLLALAAFMVGLIRGRRRVVTFHGGVDGGVIQPTLEGWRRPVAGLLLRIVFTFSHIVICNSEVERRALMLFQGGSKKIFAIPAFSRQYLEYQEVALDASLEQFVENHSPVLSMYVCYRDGFFTEVVIDAMARLLDSWPDVGLVSVGTGDGLPEFRSQIASQRLESNVYIAGNLDHDNFMTLMSRSDLHLRTHTGDGVSATVLEALSLGVPVVASDVANRPPGVITYEATNSRQLGEKLDWCLRYRSDIVDTLECPQIEDTAQIEIDLLLGKNLSDGAVTGERSGAQ